MGLTLMSLPIESKPSMWKYSPEPRAAFWASLPEMPWAAWLSSVFSKNIRRDYPNGVRKLCDGGYWNTIAGQPTYDSEMALMLPDAVDQGTYIPW